MPTLLHEGRPTARKDHRCSCCTGLIRAGLPYVRETYVGDGHVYDWLVCDPCDALDSVVWRWADRPADEGIDRDDYIEWAREHLSDPQHGDAAHALLVRAGQPVEDGDR